MDGWVAEQLHQLVGDHPAVVDWLEVITVAGRPQTLVWASALLAVLWWVKRSPRAALLVVVATIGAWALNVGLKDLVDRERPVWDTPLATSSGASFPSGHAMVSAATATAVALVRRKRRVTIAVAVFVVVIAVTRVALGVHWLSDVGAGAGLGAAWSWCCARVLLHGEEDLRTRDRSAA